MKISLPAGDPILVCRMQSFSGRMLEAGGWRLEAPGSRLQRCNLVLPVVSKSVVSVVFKQYLNSLTSEIAVCINLIADI